MHLEFIDLHRVSKRVSHYILEYLHFTCKFECVATNLFHRSSQGFQIRECCCLGCSKGCLNCANKMESKKLDNVDLEKNDIKDEGGDKNEKKNDINSNLKILAWTYEKGLWRRQRP